MAEQPMYRQIAEDLRRKIEAGELPTEPGRALPTEIELREQYGASRNTVRDAIKSLTTRGLVETRPGQGTFVTERILPFVTTLTGEPSSGGGEEDIYLAEVAASSRKPKNAEPRVEIHRASQSVAGALGLQAGVHVVSRHQERFIDGKPWSLQTSFYPRSLVEEGAELLQQPEDIEGGAVAYLARECGIKQASYQDSIEVRAPDSNETTFFQIPPDGRVAVFKISRVGFEENGSPFRLTITVYPTDRNRLVVNVGPVPLPPAAEEES